MLAKPGLWFDVLSQSPTANAQLLRLNASTGAGILSVSRVAANGYLSFRIFPTNYTFTAFHTNVTKSAWHQLVVQTVVNPGAPSAGKAGVWLDGVAIDEMTSDLGSRGVAQVQLGDQTATPTFDVAFDDVDVSKPGDDGAPSGLYARAIAQDRVDLSWAPPATLPGLAGYHLYRDGQLLATTPGTTYSDLSTEASTQYAYHVTAYTTGATESAPSETIPIATPSGSLPSILPDSTWQVNGTVRALQLIGTTMWIGGQFTQLKSPDGSQVIAVNNPSSGTLFCLEFAALVALSAA